MTVACEIDLNTNTVLMCDKATRSSDTVIATSIIESWEYSDSNFPPEELVNWHEERKKPEGILILQGHLYDPVKQENWVVYIENNRHRTCRALGPMGWHLNTRPI
jgi:hypothetical protein